MKRFAFVAVLFFALSLEAKTLVVADIDDTLRVTNRLYGSYVEQLDNVLDMEMPFSGMKELMKAFHHQDAAIYYLTAAVKPLNTLGADFLEYQKFPQRENFIFRPWWSDVESFKTQEVLNLILRENPDVIVLIGDNGEKDPAAYANVQALYPQTQVYIHDLYRGGTSAYVPESQVAYVTSAEIAAHLEERGVFTTYESHYVMKRVAEDLLSGNQLKKYLVLPYWSDITSAHIIDIYSRPFTITAESQQFMFIIGESLL